MKILHIVYSFNNGGIERLLCDIFQNWCEEDEINLLVINDDYNPFLIREISTKPNQNIMLLHRKKGSSKIMLLIKLLKSLRSKRFDIVHIHSLSTIKLILSLKIMGVSDNFVYHVHDMGLVNRISKFDQIVLNKYANFFIAISKPVYNEIKNKFLKKNICLIYNGIDFKRFEPNYSSKGNNNYILIGNVARLNHEKKGQDVLIEAISKTKNKSKIKCFFAGGGEKKEFDFLSNLAKKLKVDEQIEFLGNVNDVSGFLKTLDIFVLPSRFEGFGISLLEAISMEIPVIASNIDGPKELIENQDLGLLFDSEDSNELARMIDELIEKPLSKEKLKQRREKINKLYSIKKVNQKLRNVYLNVIKGDE